MPHSPRTSRPLVIHGAGGHGQVVAEAALAAGLPLLGFLDDQPLNPDHLPAPQLAPDDPRLADACFHVAVGDNATRLRLTEHLLAQQRPLATVVHPDAHLSPSASLGQGVFVGPRALVHTHARIADGCIINSAALIEHHNTIAPFTHVAPGAVLAGNVHVGRQSLIGLNATALPGIRIGNHCTVAAAALVTRHVPDHQTVLGSPARPHPSNNAASH